MATKKTTGTAVSKAAAFDYAPAPESRSIVDIKASYGLFINGEFVDGTGTRFKTINPATEEVLAEVSEASEADVEAAVKAARRANSRVWGPMPGKETAKYPYRIDRIIPESGRELGERAHLHQGQMLQRDRERE